MPNQNDARRPVRSPGRSDRNEHHPSDTSARYSTLKLFVGMCALIMIGMPSCQLPEHRTGGTYSRLRSNPISVVSVTPSAGTCLCRVDGVLELVGLLVRSGHSSAVLLAFQECDRGRPSRLKRQLFHHTVGPQVSCHVRRFSTARVVFEYATAWF